MLDKYLIYTFALELFFFKVHFGHICHRLYFTKSVLTPWGDVGAFLWEGTIILLSRKLVGLCGIKEWKREEAGEFVLQVVERETRRLSKNL